MRSRNKTNTCALFAFLIAFASVAAASDEVWSLHGQDTVVTQGHGSFTSPYSGQNSLNPGNEIRTSETGTLFLGRRLWSSGAMYVNPEISAGSGFSHTQGIAGFPNGEIYRVDTPAPKLNLARLYVVQTFGFGDEKEQIEPDKNQLASTVSARRLTVIGGKFSLSDFFDGNAYSHDPRTQFMNWSLMDNGAWDYAADTRGYTWGIYLEYNDPRWAVRFCRVLMPTVANGLELDTDTANAYGDNLEFESRHTWWEHPGKVRVLAYWNHAHMGNYANATFNPIYNTDITQTRRYSSKWGWGLNFEQEITSDLGLFSRIGWNDGHNETWVFTEIDRTASIGVSLKPAFIGRPQDTLGAAFVINGLSSEHADYLNAGGLGFLIGDGRIGYAPEQILESYYLWTPFTHFGATLDYLFVNHPAYNADRGPVSVFSARLHYEI